MKMSRDFFRLIFIYTERIDHSTPRPVCVGAARAFAGYQEGDAFSRRGLFSII